MDLAHAVILAPSLSSTKAPAVEPDVTCTDAEYLQWTQQMESFYKAEVNQHTFLVLDHPEAQGCS